MTGPGARLIVAAVACACVGVLLTMPRAVLPERGPSLAFEAAAEAEVLARDRALAAAVPSGEARDTLVALYEAQGRAETGEGETEEEFAARRAEINAARQALVDSHGEEALAQLRAEAVEALLPALAGEASEEEALLGSFPRMLERYGASEGGERVAPVLVLRTLFAARWNGVMGLSLVDGFSEVEKQAYWGWVALGAADVPPTRRRQALIAFTEVGGLHALEAQGWLAYREGDYVGAARFYQQAAEASGDLRLRNHALACQGLIQ